MKNLKTYETFLYESRTVALYEDLADKYVKNILSNPKVHNSIMDVATNIVGLSVDSAMKQVDKQLGTTTGKEDDTEFEDYNDQQGNKIVNTHEDAIELIKNYVTDVSIQNTMEEPPKPSIYKRIKNNLKKKIDDIFNREHIG